MRTPYQVIKRKRDGFELAPDEIKWFISEYAGGRVEDHQASAFLMAVFFRGASDAEALALTEALVESGETLDLTPLERSFGAAAVDKHSTGGVGDKVTLVVVPIVASCGVPMVKLSGRGLGHTGGTIDKLESVPGFRSALKPEEMLVLAARTGAVIASQSPRMVPADARLYALRDVTATVDSVPLIAASVMSKKIACGARGIFLDVKAGEGAFMRTRDRAAELARLMVSIGEKAKRRVVARISPMDEPLGLSAGNALEVREAMQTLGGEGPRDLETTCLEIAAGLLMLGGKASDASEGLNMARRAIDTGSALRKMIEIVSGQGGKIDPEASNLPAAPLTRTITAPRPGRLTRVSALRIGQACVALGAGRLRKGDDVDPAAGVVLLRKPPAEVSQGEALAQVHASGEAQLEAGAVLASSAFEIS